jgi:ABC-type nitrate/sulfonate/bicarbonate transport system permease component
MCGTDAVQRMNRLLLPCVGIALLLLAWELAGRALGAAILAPPTIVAVDYIALLRGGEMLTQLVLSLRETAIAYIAACAVGMPLGVAMGRSRATDAIAHPWVAMCVVTSTAAMVPLLILFLGTGSLLRIAVIFVAAVFYIVLATYNGAKGISPNQIAVGVSFGAGRLRIFRSIMLPALFPYLLTAARIGLVHAIRAMVTVELFVIAGYGGLIHQSGLAVDTGPLLGLLFTLMLASTLLDLALRTVARLLAPWYYKQRSSTSEAR